MQGKTGTTTTIIESRKQYSTRPGGKARGKA
nr:MAG TPA: hypothetical protein [Caudoviricetes sp.]